MYCIKQINTKRYLESLKNLGKCSVVWVQWTDGFSDILNLNIFFFFLCATLHLLDKLYTVKWVESAQQTENLRLVLKTFKTKLFSSE